MTGLFSPDLVSDMLDISSQNSKDVAESKVERGERDMTVCLAVACT